ncbi:hypothetical protein [Luteimonas sp. MC1828]|uniref:hypothetical protein n=1 Tax=Luteimonas sp. MC1828 TaxID=2799787 RepID=UPI0018F1A4F3|nr:hypothetical protein [Luteimonas sp. MC1828]MBJ7575045.1 hypothetical protein [Luteimonas sp. MC1828]
MVPSPARAPGAPHHAHHLAWLLALPALLAAVHAVALAGSIANPLVYSDNWTFIETFLKVALEDGAGFGDFLVRRAGVDHAQPLGKLLMLANARWAGLDFMFEARVALGCVVAGWALLCVVVLRERGEVPVTPLVVFLMAAVLVVQLAPASVDVYAYPMVLMAHAFYLLAFVVLAAVWHAYRGGRAWPLVLAMAACGIVGDDSAILLVAAAAPALLLAGAREQRLRSAWRVVALLVLVLLACRGAYALFGEIRGSTSPDFNVGMAARVAGLAAQWRDAWAWLATPLSAGLASGAALRATFGDGWLAARIALALLVGGLHAWFWWRAWRLRPGATWFLAVALMLLFYAMVAGVLYGRVFVRGTAFLDQGRYSVFYQVGIVALLLMALAEGALASGRARALAWGAGAALLLLQLPLALHAWQQVPGHRDAYAHMARDMAAMARDPLHPPAGCAVGIDVCVRPEATRVALMAMLVEHRLNLFSPRFQARHPELARAAGLLPQSAAPAE